MSEPKLTESSLHLLRHEFVDHRWALDVATRLLSYDPRAHQVLEVRWEPGDRAVITYYADFGWPASRARPKRTFIIPKWTPPEQTA